MAETDNPNSDLERLKAAVAAADKNLTLDSFDEAIKALVAAARNNPTVDEALAKAIEDNPEVWTAVQRTILRTVLKAVKKGAKPGTTAWEILAALEPLTSPGEGEELSEAVQNIHALLQINNALELLMGEDYHPSMTVDELLSHAGMTKDDLKTLPPDEVLERLSEAQPPQDRLSDSVYEAAALIFEQRYGWKSGDTRKLTIQQLWLAFEHALEDKSGDPKGVWKLTS